MVADILISMRPRQWLKNIFVFAGLVFTGQFVTASRVGSAVGVFVLFWGLSGAGYLINDVMDRQRDREHPRKRLRPITAGRVPVWVAVGLAALVIPVGVGAGFLLSVRVGTTLAIYVILTLVYSTWLKHMLIVDVIAVALGYVLRVLAGGFAVDVISTPWSLVCTFFLALLLSIGKRLAEIRGVGQGTAHRFVLSSYSANFLGHMLLVAAISTILSYVLFTFTSGRSLNLMLTIPFVVYGVLRYLFLVEMRQAGENPEMLVLEDAPLLFNSIMWGVLAVGILYIGG